MKSRGEDQTSLPHAAQREGEHSPKSGGLSLPEFRARLIASGLMSDEECRTFLETLSSVGMQSLSGKELAQELCRQGKLTRFQATAVYQGKTRGLILGNYVILDLIGKGGMGHVYKALHRKMRREVALKVLSKSAMKSADAAQRFQREVEAAAQLSHPNIVAAYDADESNGVRFLVMEYVRGNDLAALVRQGNILPVGAAIDYIVQAARGLEYAHQRGIIHRDIKPSNMLLDEQGCLKVLDMGLARFDATVKPARSPGERELTQSGQVMGTFNYMAPEQATHPRAADARADVYSLGCTLYYLLAGRPPFEGDTFASLVVAHREQAIPSLLQVRPDVPRAVDAVYQKMLAKQPEDRLQTMTEVIVALEPFASGDSPPPQVEPSTSPGQETVSFCQDHQKDTSRSLAPSALLLRPTSRHARGTRIRPGSKKISPVVLGLAVSAVALVGLLAVATFLGERGEAPAPRKGSALAASEPAPELKSAPEQPPNPAPIAASSQQPSQGLATTPKAKVVIDASQDGGMWWSPAPNAPYFGWSLAEFLRSAEDYHVVEVRQNHSPVKDLEDCDVVIRIGGSEASSEVISAYQRHLDKGGVVLLPWNLGAKTTGSFLDAFGLQVTPQERGSKTETPVIHWQTSHPLLYWAPQLGIRHGPVRLIRGDGAVPIGWLDTQEAPEDQAGVVIAAPRGKGMILAIGCDYRLIKPPTMGVVLMVRYLDRVRRGNVAPTVITFDAASARQYQEACATRLGVHIDVRNSLGMEFVLIPQGRLTGPHASEALYFARHELTVGQFRQFLERAPYTPETTSRGARCYGFDASQGQGRSDVSLGRDYNWENPGFPQQDDHPVVCVTNGDAVALCEWLSRTEQQTYRLPTAAEWEFACRAGNKTIMPVGEDLKGMSGIGNIYDASLKRMRAPSEPNSLEDDGYAFTAPVGSFPANPFGLFDMTGNVAEYCSDWTQPGVRRRAIGPVWNSSLLSGFWSMPVANGYATIGVRLVREVAPSNPSNE